MARTGTDGPPTWLRHAAVWVGAGIALVVLALLGVALLPGWWASVVGAWVHGVSGRGVPLGLTIGAVFTLVPIVLGGLAARSASITVLRHTFDRPTVRQRIVLIVLSLLLLLPNVLTIAIWAGGGDPRSVLVIEAPGFRGATVVGIGLVVLFVAVGAIAFSRRGRRSPSAPTESADDSEATLIPLTEQDPEKN